MCFFNQRIQRADGVCGAHALFEQITGIRLTNHSRKSTHCHLLCRGKHIIGIAYRDGKALAIFSVTDINRRGVATGDGNDVRQWILILALSALALAAVCILFVMTGKKKKKRKKKTSRQ